MTSVSTPLTRKNTHKAFSLQDLGNYVILFDSVFLNKEIKELFYKALKKEFATENYDFIMDVDKLEKLDKLDEIIAHATFIIDNYLITDSKQELNVAAGQKDKILDLYAKSRQRDFPKKWRIDISPKDLFAECKKSTYTTLQHDNFKRFIRSPDFYKIIANHVEDPHVAVARVSYQFNYSDDDFHKEIIHQKDFEFMRMLMVDGFNWEVVGTKHSAGSLLTSYFSTVNYLAGCSWTHKHAVNAVKYETILNFPFNQALGLYPLENFLDMDPNSNRIDVIYYAPTDGEKYDRDHYVSRTTCQFPLMDYRTFRAVVSTDYDKKKKRVIQILKSCDTEKRGPYLEPRTDTVCLKKGFDKSAERKTYTMFNFMAIVMEKLDDYRTNYTQIMLCGLGGYADNVTMAKMITHDRGCKLKATLIRKLKTQIPSDITLDELKAKYPDDAMMKQLCSLKGLEENFPQKWNGFVREYVPIKRTKSMFDGQVFKTGNSLIQSMKSMKNIN